jgi:predicted metal-dependent hydrolase
VPRPAPALVRCSPEARETRITIGLDRTDGHPSPMPLRRRDTATPALSSRRLEHRGAAIEIAVRESTRARRIRLVVHGSGAVEVVAPSGTTDRVVDELITTHRAWIADHVRRARERRSHRPTLELDRPGFVPLQGTSIPIVRRPAGRALAQLERGRLVVGGPEADTAGAVLRWYRREARARIGVVVEREAARLGLGPGALSVRDQRSRWASCSRSGHLSFSWRLLLAPPDVLDYVVVHELCHLVEPNHSKAFWGLVDQAVPGWRRQAAWLRDHAEELHAFMPRTTPGPA